MNGDISPPILVVLRASPLRERTTALLASIELQKPAGIAKVVALSPRGLPTGLQFPLESVEQLPAEPDWMRQVRRLAMASECRWLVLPSSVDRYLPGAFEAVVELGAEEGQTVVGPCQVVQHGQPIRIGPDPFRFDYFALLMGFNYIAPGATFIDIRRCLAEEGFDPRFPTALAYESLLRTGAAGGAECCGTVLLETEAEPFPGIPADWAVLYASEALALTLNYNRSLVTPGAALGLMAVLADRVAVYGHTGMYDNQVVARLSAGSALLKRRYLDQLALASASETPPQRTLRARIKAVTPRSVWDTLRRARGAWDALRRPLE